MINKTFATIYKCQNCDIILENIGTQYICCNCNYQPLQFLQQIRVVPQKYQSNCKQKRQLDYERKMNVLIREFTDKYRDISDSQQIKYLREKITSIKRQLPKKKGIRQIAGVVSYFHLIDDVKTNIKDYCKNNNLNLKIFNQKYKVYHKLFKNILIQPQNDIKQLKTQQKIQESNTTEKSNDQDIYEDSQLDQLAPCISYIQDQEIEPVFRQSLNIIFDDIFSNYFYRQKKQIIINKMFNQVKKINRDFFSRIRFKQNPSEKIYYLILGLLKTLEFKISYYNFSEIVKTKTGFLLKRKTAGSVKKYYELYSNNEQNNSPLKVEQTSNS